MKILAIDPSVMNSAGWATLDLEWEHGEISTPRGMRLPKPMHLRGRLIREDWNFGAWELSGMNFKMRCGDLRDYIERDIGSNFDSLVCEWPMFYDSAKGQIAAQKGYTVNLAGIAMYIAGWFKVRHENLFLYTAPDWKGTVKKTVTAYRFYKLFDVNMMKLSHDTIDATMMLLHHCKKVGLIR